MSQISLEQTILRNIIVNESFMRKALPFIKAEYFEGVHKQLFKQVCKFVGEYNTLPTMESLKIEIDDSNFFTDETYMEAIEALPFIFKVEPIEEQWLIDNTEKWCQDRSLHIAIMDSIEIIQGNVEGVGRDALPSMLSDALAVSFDSSIGHDYYEDVEQRYDYYHTEIDRIPFHLELMNKITRGGVPNKTLNVILAGTGVGKSLFMCSCAAGSLTLGKNVLYLTMEMSEEKIAERIDANLLDCDITELDKLSKKEMVNGISKIKNGANGKLIIKEYPTGYANANNFRALLNELKLKKKFVPDIIFIDYLNICSSARMKTMGGSINSYTYIKAIAEELRGLGVEFNVPIFTATQTTRAGYANSDPTLDDTSESFGLPATADLMFALVTSEELEKDGLLCVKQLKNRYNDITKYRKFVIGTDKAKMRLFDAPDEAQTLSESGIADDGPVFDKTEVKNRFNDFTF